MCPEQHSPRFGEADLSNCEKELIHLPGSIQPHGTLLVLEEPDLRILQVSANVESLLGCPPQTLLRSCLEEVNSDLAKRVQRSALMLVGSVRRPLVCRIGTDGARRTVPGLIHRSSARCLILEIEEDVVPPPVPVQSLPERLNEGLARIEDAWSFETLKEVVVEEIRALTGYDRVMLYQFDPDGHGEVVAERRREELEPYLGLHYPASDIPQRARELYLRNRVRLLGHVDYEAVPLLPRLNPLTGADLDMSMSYLRSISPIHLQYLRNMGVTATLVVSVIQEHELWGLVACHHYEPKVLPYPTRAACDLVAQATATRLTLFESFQKNQAEVLVRSVEQSLAETVPESGDWRHALFRNARILLGPFGATGAALIFDGETFTAGDVPGTRALENLVEWIAERADGPLFYTPEVPHLEPAFEPIASVASGVLAVELSRERREYLLWLRGERVQYVEWAGNPQKPVVVGDDPRDLSPRRSFAVWKEEVHHRSRAWSSTEQAAARYVGESLRELIIQVRGMRVLLAQRQMQRIRRGIQASPDPLLVADRHGRVLLVNEAFSRSFVAPHVHLETLDDLPPLFTDPARARRVLEDTARTREGWRGELVLRGRGRGDTPVSLRVDVVRNPESAREGFLGYVILMRSLREEQLGEEMRRNLQSSAEGWSEVLEGDGAGVEASPFNDLARRIFRSADLAAMEIPEGDDSLSLLHSVEGATRRATEITTLLKAYLREHEGDA